MKKCLVSKLSQCLELRGSNSSTIVWDLTEVSGIFRSLHFWESVNRGSTVVTPVHIHVAMRALLHLLRIDQQTLTVLS